MGLLYPYPISIRVWGIASRLSDSSFCQNLFVDTRNNSTLYFCANPSFAVGDTRTNQKVREAKTSKEIRLQTAVTKALKDLSPNVEEVYVDIAGCYDANGTAVESDVSGTFTVTEYDSQNCSFKIELNVPLL